MKLLFLLLLCTQLVATTLTGSLNYPNTAGMSGYLIMSLSQQAALVAAGGCGGPIEVVPTYQYRITVTSGALIGSPSVYGNDCMLPQGTYYNVQVTDTNANILFTDRWVITGTTLNIGTIVSATISGTTQTLGQAGVLLTNPTGNQTVTQGVGTNFNVNLLNVTGVLTMPNGGTCTITGCSGLIVNAVTTDSTVQTIIGQKTFSANTTFFTGVTASLGDISELVTGTHKLVLGPVASPTDFHLITNYPAGHVRIQDSALNQIALFGDESGFDSNPLFAVPGGYIQGDAGVITNTHTGDFACSGFPDGTMTIRSDTSPPQLQVCVGGTLYVVSLGG